MKLLTIFTPTYNRKHTICRTYESLQRQTCKDFNWLIIDDGSSDGTRQWVESLGNKVILEGIAYDWMGCPLKFSTSDHFIIEANGMCIEYVAKPNGGLYSGYNVAYDIIDTELCVCVDSDDFMPDDAVEKISKKWKEYYPQGSLISNFSPLTNTEYCGMVGLDYNVVNKLPIGGEFDNYIKEGIYYNIKHSGDTKEVMRTELMKKVSPQIGFEGEKDFNPFYMLSQIVDKYSILVENSNLCWVEYQVGNDSMSQAIFKQFKRSPKSYAKYRINQMKLTHGNNVINKFKLSIHYISSCIFSHDSKWLTNSPERMLTVLAVPFGIMLNLYIRYKAGK